MSQINLQEFGELKATVSQLKETQDELIQKVDKLVELWTQANGALKVIRWIAAGAAAGYSLYAFLIKHVRLV
jgi:hypothetical protein